MSKEEFHFRMRSHPWHVLRINKMLSCAGADRLQAGMRQAYGKSYGKASRVRIGDELVSVRIKKDKMKDVLEALRRGSNKLPGRQKIFVSVNYGFSKYKHHEVAEAIEQEKLISMGTHVKVETEKGPLANTLLF